MNPYTDSKNNTRVYYLLLAVFSAIICTIVLVFDTTKPDYYLYLHLLPITFAVCSGIAANTYGYLFRKLSITIIILTYFIRMVVLPVIISLGDYSIIFGNYRVVIPYGLVHGNMDKAILLMCYEAIVVFITLATKKFKTKDFLINNRDFEFDYKLSKKSPVFKIVIAGMLLFISFSLGMYPILTNYVSFFIATSVEKDLANSIALLSMRESVPSIIYWAYILVFNTLQVFVPILIIQRIYTRYGKNKPKRAVCLSLIISIIVFSFMTPEKATSVLLGIVLLIIVFILYPRIMKKIAPITFLFLGIAAIMGLLLKAGVYRYNNNVWEFISATLNAYFSGPLNVSAALSMQQSVSIDVIFSDILNSIPFLGHFFKGWNTTPKHFNYAIKGYGTSVTKIIPMVGQGYFYFGFILAPIISFFCVSMAIKYEKKADASLDVFKKYIYLFATVLFSISPIMYNFNIMLSTLCYIVMYFILMKLADVKL